MQCTETEIARLRLMAKAFECVGEAIVITDAENRIIMVNPAFSKMTGYLAEDVLG
jgi:PAS domain S-box-containing protein